MKIRVEMIAKRDQLKKKHFSRSYQKCGEKKSCRLKEAIKCSVYKKGSTTNWKYNRLIAHLNNSGDTIKKIASVPAQIWKKTNL